MTPPKQCCNLLKLAQNNSSVALACNLLFKASGFFSSVIWDPNPASGETTYFFFYINNQMCHKQKNDEKCFLKVHGFDP